jgi:membrane-bound lytic murein transglycosylase D
MWQFIPSTGRIMGLRQDSGYDGRRDVLASTKAAMDYLTQLQRRLGGSWELAMAAYNCGPGRVESAQAANLRAGRPSDFWSLDLPAETEAYVPQILAAARLVSEPAKYGLSLPPVPAGHQMELVKSDRPVDLVRVAQASGVQVSELQRLNPGIVNGYSASQVLVPAGAGGRVGSGLGRVQVVPATAAAATLSPVRAVARVPSALPTPAIDTSGPRPEPARRPAAEGRVHVVRSGESLASIARAQGLEVQDLAELNAMRSGEPLLPGQSLRLPGSGGRHSALAAELVTHRVQRGDSIAAIARRYGVTVADVKRWNPVAGNALRSGGLIRIYRKGGTAS